MIEDLKQILTAQFEAALSMLKDCVETCPQDHWEGIIGKYPFWHVAYHALCYLDLYLSPDETGFHPHAMHPQGWAEYEAEYPSRMFKKKEILSYIDLCRTKVIDNVAAETAESLQGGSGHKRRKFSRTEMHLYNLRHLQHHVGQLSAHIRRIAPQLQELNVMPWAGSGWREASEASRAARMDG